MKGTNCENHMECLCWSVILSLDPNEERHQSFPLSAKNTRKTLAGG